MSVWWLAASAGNAHSSYDELKSRKVLAQGWAKIGDIKALTPLKNGKEYLFKKIIKKMVLYCYGKNPDSYSNSERRICNLLKIQKGDIVVVCEGTTVKGLAKITNDVSYSFDGNYDYAHQIGPVDAWKDWDSSIVGNAPRTKAFGPEGVQRCMKNEYDFITAWNNLP